MSNVVLDWINSGEYKSDIDELRTTIMRDCAQSNSESTTASIFERELYFLVRSKTGISLDFEKESKVDNVKHIFGTLKKRTSGKGRLDAILNNLVIEYKHHSKLQTSEQYQTAINQVKDYLMAIKENDDIECNAILTDGVRICFFSFVNGNLHNNSLSPISNDDIDRVIRALVTNQKKRFIPDNILKDFSIIPNTDSISKSFTKTLYKILVESPTEKTSMLYEEWKSLMHLSVEDNGKSGDIAKRRNDLEEIVDDIIDSTDTEYKALYALQTTYAIIVKLIACKVVDKLDYSEEANSFYDLTNTTSDNLQRFFEKIEYGYAYKNSNINNFLEGDFFSWYSDKNQWNADLWKLMKDLIKIVDTYTSFSFNIIYQPIDIFKDLYMAIIPRSIRHSMGEYFTPDWLADYVVTESIALIDNENWKAIDPCCGSGIFIISLIKKIVGNIDLQDLTDSEKRTICEEVLNRVYGIDINPLSVLSARVGYYLALQPFGEIKNVDIPIYLGDSAIIPIREEIDGIDCYSYSVTNQKLPFKVVFPVRLVKETEFCNFMNQLQAYVKTDNKEILITAIEEQLTDEELESSMLIELIQDFADNLVQLHKNNWDGIWVRISTNFMLIARLSEFEIIVGNPPWVKWEHLPSSYASKIKELCDVKHIFSNDGGQFGGTQLNICALISNVTATNWLTDDGILAFLMPDSIMSQNSYEEFRNFYLDYENNKRLYLQKIDKWEPPLRPFRCDDKPITQDFNTYYFGHKEVDYKEGIPVKLMSRSPRVKDDILNKKRTFKDVKPYLLEGEIVAKQLAENSTAFSYMSKEFDFSKIIGETAYKYRTGVEFTPQELFMLTGVGKSDDEGHYKFNSKTFALSKYVVDDDPKGGWNLPTKYIYPIARGPNLSPFRCSYENAFAIVPYDENNTKQPIDSKRMLREQEQLFDYLVKHKELIESQSEKSKQMRRGKEFYSLSKLGVYTYAENIVAARDNSKFCASVINRQSTPWGEVKQTICVKHTIIISQDKEGNFISENEANYICGVLNSSIVISYIHNTFKRNGFSLNKSNLYLPKYDETNRIHRAIANLAKKAQNVDDEEIPIIQDNLSRLYLELCENK